MSQDDFSGLCSVNRCITANKNNLKRRKRIIQSAKPSASITVVVGWLISNKPVRGRPGVKHKELPDICAGSQVIIFRYGFVTTEQAKQAKSFYKLFETDRSLKRMGEMFYFKKRNNETRRLTYSQFR